MDDKRYIDRNIDRAKMCSFDDWKLDFSTYVQGQLGKAAHSPADNQTAPCVRAEAAKSIQMHACSDRDCTTVHVARM